jgi:VanZ family protein
MLPISSHFKAAIELCARVGAGASLLTTLVLSLLPAEDLPDSLSLVSDKIEHAAAYAAIAGCTIVGFRGASTRSTAIWLALMGAAIEVAQAAGIPGRTGDVMDWLADAVGIALGLLCGRAFQILIGLGAHPDAA